MNGSNSPFRASVTRKCRLIWHACATILPAQAALVLAAAITLLTQSATAQDSIVFQQGAYPVPSYAGCEDAHIIMYGTYGWTGNRNAGAHDYLEEGDWWGVEDPLPSSRPNPGFDDNKMILLKFDLSSVGPGSAVGNAYLRMFYDFQRNEVVSAIDHYSWAHMLSKPWGEGLGTGFDGPAAAHGECSFVSARTGIEDWETSGARGLSDIQDPATFAARSNVMYGSSADVWIEWDITDFVQYWIDHPEQNHGLKVSQDETGYATSGYHRGGYDFRSSEHATSSTRPMLVIDGSLVVVPLRPAAVYPLDGDTNTTRTPDLISTAFHSEASTETHAASQWQIATGMGDFSSSPPLIWDTGPTASHLNEIQVPQGLLDHGVWYSWRVRHQGSSGLWSAWSEPASFRTQATATVYPTVITLDLDTVVGTESVTESLTILNLGTGPLIYSIEGMPASLVSVTPSGGNLQSYLWRQDHIVEFHTAALPAGNHEGEIRITGNATNTPLTIPVSISVRSVSPITVGKGGGFDYQTIQAAIDAASLGDTIRVHPAVYYERIDFKGKDIILESTDPTATATVAATIVDGQSGGPVVTFSGTETEHCILSGFTIRNGRTVEPYPNGAGIRGNHTLAAILNNVIRNNTAEGNGAGIHECDGLVRHNTVIDNVSNSLGGGGGLYSCDGSIEDNVISRNHAIAGGGLAYCDGTILNNEISGNSSGFAGGGGLNACNGLVENNTVTFNTTDGRGGGMLYCSGEVCGNVFANNSADMGGGLARCDGRIFNNLVTHNEATGDSIRNGGGGGLAECIGEIRNNTVVANEALWGAGLSECSGSIVSCIIWGNIAPTDPQLFNCSTPTYSCITHWSGGGTGNTSDDPLFIRGLHGDYYLFNTAAGQPFNSPCVDTGDRPAHLAGLEGRTTRIDGVADSGTVDMGYHFPLGARPPMTITVGKGGGFDFDTIQAAIDVAVAGDTIIVHPATYVENINFNGKDLVVLSIDPADPSSVATTIIDANQFGSVVTFAGAETTGTLLAGFTIRNGVHVETFAPVDHGTFGCGIEGNGTFASVEHCVIVNNQGSMGSGLLEVNGAIRRNRISNNNGGGGTLHECNGLIEENEITSNTAMDGGGMRMCNGTIRHNLIGWNTSSDVGGGLSFCTGDIVNNLIIHNTIGGTHLSVGAYGAGISNCDGLIANNTVAFNTILPTGGLGEGGGGLADCDGVVRDNIIYFNTSPQDPQIFRGSVPTYSCIQDWTGGGEGNISDDPLFVSGQFGEFYLSQTASGQSAQSPCVNAGSGTAAGSGLANRTTRTDSAADTGVVDMGYHYERGPAIAVLPQSFSIVLSQPTGVVTRPLSVWNQGAGTLDYDLETSFPIDMEVIPSSGISTGGTVAHEVRIPVYGLALGVYRGSITVRGNAPNSPFVIPVELDVQAIEPPAIRIEVPQPLVATLPEGETHRFDPAFFIHNDGIGTLNFQASVVSLTTGTSATWLSIQEPLEGSIPGGDLESRWVEFDATGLTPQLYEANIRIEHNDPTEHPFEFPCLLDVEPKPIGPPNLTISAADFEPAATIVLEPGDPLAFGAFIENQGEAPAGPFWTELWGSRTGGLMLDQFLVQSLKLESGLAAGEAYPWSTTATLYGIPDGPYTVVFAVDRPNEVEENDERDNRAVVEGKRVLVIRPPTNVDLTVEGFGMAPNPAQAGQQLTFSGRVLNQGTEPSGPFWIEFWGSWEWPYPSRNFYLCDSIFVENLDPEQAIELAEHSPPLYDVPSGVFMVGCIVDGIDGINELDETNNYQFIDGQVFNSETLIEREAPDLNAGTADIAILSADFLPAAPGAIDPGTTFALSAEITNQGLENTGPFWVEYWGSRDGGLTLDEFIADSTYLPNLGAGRTVPIQFTASPYSLADGPYTVVIVVDRPGEVAESDETNNRHAVAGKRLLMLHLPKEVNLQLRDFELTQRLVGLGQDLLGTIVNTSLSEDSGPFWIEFWGSWNEDYPTLDFFVADSIRVENLGPGESIDLDDYNIYTVGMPPAEYTIIGFVDRLDQVNETNEADNYMFIRPDWLNGLR